MEVLQIESISKRYGRTKAVSDFSLSIGEGNVYGILGPNGSGKTTILAIILGIIRQNSGFFRWFNQDENSVYNQQIGALLETPNFYPYLSLSQNLKISAEIKQISDDHDLIIDEVLTKTGLVERKFSKYISLSYGMKQRLALANVLLGDPQVLVLDEPTNGLDPEGISDVREMIINEAKNGKTIIMASHILDEVEKICSHVAILKKGQLIEQGKIRDIIKTDNMLVISSDDIPKLHELIVRSGLCKKVEKLENEIIITLENNVNPKDINEFAFKHNIILTKFEEKKSSLESEFLKIVK